MKKYKKNYKTMYYFSVPVKNVWGDYGGNVYTGRAERVLIIRGDIVKKMK